MFYRDFALRNCLVSSDMTIKVGDYGLAEEIYKVQFGYSSFDARHHISDTMSIIFFIAHGTTLLLLHSVCGLTVWSNLLLSR